MQPRSIDRGLRGRASNHTDSNMHEHLQAFYEEMIDHAVPRATWIVRQHVVGTKDEEVDDGSNSDADDQVMELLRKTDVDVVDLPPPSQSVACTSVSCWSS